MSQEPSPPQRTLLRFESQLWGSSLLSAWRSGDWIVNGVGRSTLKAALEGIVGYELVVEGTHGHDEKGPEVEAQWQAIATSILSRLTDNALLVVTEGFPSLPNRLRRFKLGVPRDVPARFVEVPRGAETLLAAIVPLKCVWSRGWFDLFAMYENCIIIDRQESDIDGTAADDLSDWIATKLGADRDFEQLIAGQCRRERIVVRTGGDGGDEEMTLQFFGLPDVVRPIVPLLLSHVSVPD